MSCSEQNVGHSPDWMRRAFAWSTSRSEAVLDRVYGDRKRELFQNLSGTVAEIGPGAGANFAWYPPGIHLLGVEPNPHMRQYLIDKADCLELNLVVHSGVAEELPFENESIDAVVSTLVLCSVGDPAKSLAEILRVLKPGGQFVFIEHVAAPKGSWRRVIQRIVKRPWRCLGDGCNTDRDTAAVIEQAGFEDCRIERFLADSPLFVINTHIAGAATK